MIMANPTITAPSNLTFMEDSTNAVITGLSVGDADGDILTVTLEAQGLLTFGIFSGLAFTEGNGASSGTRFSFSGSVADINAALASLDYTAIADSNAPDALSITVRDGTVSPNLNAFGAVFEVADLLSANGGDGSEGFVINGRRLDDESGEVVASAGDVNGDGIDDIIIGATRADPSSGTSAGEAYIVFGQAGGFNAEIDLNALPSSMGFRINGQQASDRAGTAVSSAGDLNGDGYDDLIVSATGANAPKTENNSGRTDDEGEVYIIFGQASGFGTSFNLNLINGTNGFIFNGADEDDRIGDSVSAAGDINGDGFDDLIIGGDDVNPFGRTDAGQAYVIFGTDQGFARNMFVSDLDGTAGFRIHGATAGDSLGVSVSNAGDFNGDGIDDLIVGANEADPGGSNAGTAYVIYGRSTGFSAGLNIAGLNANTGLRIEGLAANDRLGTSVSAAGDINGDGIDDIVIGATGNGAAYVVFGSSSSLGPAFDVSTLNGTNGFALNNVVFGSEPSTSVSNAGDINGDGIDDLLVGAGFADPNSVTNAGEVYVVFGSTGGFSASIDPSQLDGTNGFVIRGNANSDWLGESVSAAGDVNGDGIDDLVVGARRADGNGIEDTGQTFVIFGREAFNEAIITETVEIDITPENDAPNLVGDASLEVNEGQTVVLTVQDVLATDIDNDDLTLTYMLTNVLAGVIEVSGVTATSFSGADLAAGLVTYTHDGSIYDGAFDLTVTDSGGAASSTIAVTVNVTQLNDLPTLTTSTASTVIEDSSGNILNGFIVADDEDDVLTVTLEAEGTFSLAGITGLVFAEGDGSDDSRMVFEGRAGDLNAALATLTYDPFADDDNGDSLTISLWDGEQDRVGAVFPASFDLADLDPANGADGSQGSLIAGLNASDNFGASVAMAGDFNGDGFEDIVIGASGLDSPTAGGITEGGGYVLFGNGTGFGTEFDLATLDGSNGFAVRIEASSFIGRNVAGIGDVNNDGFDDIIFETGTGFDSYIVYGTSTNLGASLTLRSSIADGITASRIRAFDTSGQFGDQGSIQNAGDFNGDGIDDFVIGAAGTNANGTDSGAAYLVYGNSSGLAGVITPGSIDGSNGFILSGGSQNERAGVSVASIGDFNADGLDDIVVATDETTNYLVFGTNAIFASGLALDNLTLSQGIALTGYSSNVLQQREVAGIGDINGDGLADFAIGDPVAGNLLENGVVTIYFGTDQATPSSLSRAQLDGTNGFRIDGLADFDSIGSDVAGAGDINGDGIDDLIIGARTLSTDTDSFVGAAYIVFGQSGGFGATFDLANLNGINGFVINGVSASDQAGTSVSAAGDVNGDGFFDLVVTAPRASDGGEAYIIYGQGDFENVTVDGALSIDITPVNDDPVLSGDFSISLDEGAGYTLIAADLLGTDVDDDDAILVYAVSNLINGAIVINGQQVTSFTGAQLSAGEVQYVHDGGETLIGAFDVLVSDDDAAMSPVSTINATIVPVNDAPTLAGDQAIAVLEGGHVSLTAADFIGADVDDVDSTLTYTITGLVSGLVEVLGVASASFTSADLANGDVSFVHDGSETLSASFDVASVDDDGAESDPLTITAAVTPVNDAPVMTGDLSLSVDEGALIVLQASDILATDVDNDDDTLIYSVSSLANGVIEVVGLTATSFTGAQLAAGEVLFRHDGSETTNAGFDVFAEDPDGESTQTVAVAVAVTPQNDLPVFTGDLEIALQRRADYVLTLADIGVTDPDNADAELEFVFINAVNIDIEVNGQSPTRITQADIAASSVVLSRPDDAASSSFSIGVLDTSGQLVGPFDVDFVILPLNRQDGTTSADRLLGDAAGDYLLGYEGNDILRGFEGNDYLRGGDGNDILRGGDGDDEVRGDAGNDTIYGGGGADDIRGGSGNDLVWYRYSTEGIIADIDGIEAGTGDAAGDTFLLVERLKGTGFDDILYGSLNQQDRLFGDAGDDQLYGRGGNDYLFGEAGADYIDGGDGIDYASYFTSSAGVRVNLENIAFNQGDAAGDVFVSIERFFGSSHDDTFIGAASADFFRGNDGADSLIGKGGDDRLFGENGDDSLNGGAGIDRLYGGEGTDMLTGGSNRDLFYFQDQGGDDTITDWQDGTDRMVFFAESGVDEFADLTIAQQGNDTLITYVEGTILLEGILASDIDAGDFAYL